MGFALLWQGAAAALVGAAVAVAAGWLVQRYIPLENRQENNDVAGLAFAIIGVLYAMVLTFVIVSVWDDGDSASDQGRSEARAAVDVRRYAEVVDPVLGQQLKTDADAYIETVTGQEWARMSHGEDVGTEGAAAIDRLWHDVDAVKPDGDAAVDRQQEARADLRALESARDARIAAGGSGLPIVMWFALIVGATLTLGSALTFGVKGSGEYYTLVGMVAAISTLLLFGVYEMEFPYERGERITSDVVTDTYRNLTGLS